MTRQAAQQRLLAPHRQYDPEEFSGELRRAMTHTKDLAVQRRNNYIGTEHLLWGLTTEDNSATRLRFGHEAVEPELTSFARVRPRAP